MQDEGTSEQFFSYDQYLESCEWGYNFILVTSSTNWPNYIHGSAVAQHCQSSAAPHSHAAPAIQCVFMTFFISEIVSSSETSSEIVPSTFYSFVAMRAWRGLADWVEWPGCYCCNWLGVKHGPCKCGILQLGVWEIVFIWSKQCWKPQKITLLYFFQIRNTVHVHTQICKKRLLSDPNKQDKTYTCHQIWCKNDRKDSVSSLPFC